MFRIVASLIIVVCLVLAWYFTGGTSAGPSNAGTEPPLTQPEPNPTEDPNVAPPPAPVDVPASVPPGNKTFNF